MADINEILRGFLETKLNENTSGETFSLGKYVEKSSPEFVNILKKANTYLLEKQKFTQGMVDYLGKFEPLEDQEIIDPATIPINFIVEYDEEDELVRYNKILEAFKEFQTSITGRYFEEQGYTLGFSVGVVQPVGDIFHLAQEDPSGFETKGGTFIVLRITVVCIITKGFGIGNEVEYKIAKLIGIGNKLSAFGNGFAKTFIGDTITNANTVYFEIKINSFDYNQFCRTSQQDTNGVFIGFDGSQNLFIKDETDNSTLTNTKVLNTGDVLKCVYSDNKLYINGEGVTNGSMTSATFTLDDLSIGLGFIGVMYDFAISTEKITDTSILSDISNGTKFIEDEVEKLEVRYDVITETDKILVNEGNQNLFTYDLQSSGVEKIRDYEADELVIPILRGHSKVKTPYTYQYTGEEVSKNINKESLITDDLTFLINKVSPLSRQFIKELHSKVEGQNNIYRLTIEYFQDTELTFVSEKIIQNISGDLSLGSVITYTLSFIDVGDEI